MSNETIPVKKSSSYNLVTEFIISILKKYTWFLRYNSYPNLVGFGTIFAIADLIRNSDFLGFK